MAQGCRLSPTSHKDPENEVTNFESCNESAMNRMEQRITIERWKMFHVRFDKSYPISRIFILGPFEKLPVKLSTLASLCWRCLVMVVEPPRPLSPTITFSWFIVASASHCMNLFKPFCFLARPHFAPPPQFFSFRSFVFRFS